MLMNQFVVVNCLISDEKRLKKREVQKAVYEDIAKSYECRKNEAPAGEESAAITARKQFQMKQWYGENAEEIECLEARVQEQFDDFYDRHRPVLWPTMPINLRNAFSH